MANSVEKVPDSTSSVLTFDKSTGVATRPKAVLYALGTGLCIAAYTVVDGLGVRQAESILGFAVWLTIGDGLLTFFIALLWKGREIRKTARPMWLLDLRAV